MIVANRAITLETWDMLYMHEWESGHSKNKWEGYTCIQLPSIALRLIRNCRPKMSVHLVYGNLLELDNKIFMSLNFGVSVIETLFVQVINLSMHNLKLWLFCQAKTRLSMVLNDPQACKQDHQITCTGFLRWKSYCIIIIYLIEILLLVAANK